jgi:transcriptional regulator with XRE-family HTH domain
MSNNSRRRLTPPANKPPPEVVNYDLETFGARLSQALLDKGWKQTDLARKVWNEVRIDNRGYESVVGRDRISQYCSGKVMPEPATLRRIAKELGKTVEWLAPNLTANAVERSVPDIAITAVAGHHDKVLVRVNKLMPLESALKIGTIIAESEEGD